MLLSRARTAWSLATLFRLIIYRQPHFIFLARILAGLLKRAHEAVKNAKFLFSIISATLFSLRRRLMTLLAEYFDEHLHFKRLSLPSCAGAEYFSKVARHAMPFLLVLRRCQKFELYYSFCGAWRWLTYLVITIEVNSIFHAGHCWFQM